MLLDEHIGDGQSVRIHGCYDILATNLMAFGFGCTAQAFLVVSSFSFRTTAKEGKALLVYKHCADKMLSG